MIIPKRDAKYYGAVHIDNYLTFTGFCKKVDSEEICDVDVFVDGKKIDTLKADKKIGKVEDIYDIEGHGFEFELSDEYFEKSHLLEFKASTGEELINSKIQTIDKNHPKFNEYRFLHSLSRINLEEIKDLYCPNNIGFLATEENLRDDEFVDYIKQIMSDFKSFSFKVLVYDTSIVGGLKNIFTHEIFEVVVINNLKDICLNLEVYLSNYEKIEKNLIEEKIIVAMRNYSTDVFCIGLGLNNKGLTVNQHESNNSYYFKKFIDNLEYLGFDSNDITKYGRTYHEVYFGKACEKYGVDIEFDMNETISRAYVYWNLKLGLSNHEFFKSSLDFSKKFAKLQ
jgi:hypothetical protein